jgi:hypothetical protein
VRLNPGRRTACARGREFAPSGFSSNFLHHIKPKSGFPKRQGKIFLNSKKQCTSKVNNDEKGHADYCIGAVWNRARCSDRHDDMGRIVHKGIFLQHHTHHNAGGVPACSDSLRRGADGIG